MPIGRTVLALVVVGSLFGSSFAMAEDDPVPQPKGKSVPSERASEDEADKASGEAAKPAESAKDLQKRVLAQLKSKEEFDRQAGAIAARDLQDKKLLTPLIGLLKDKSEEVRLAAVRALVDREDAKARKSAAKAIAARLGGLSKSSATQDELLEFLAALDDLAERSTIPALLSDIETGTSTDVIDARLAAVANIPHADAIDALIKLASSGRRRGGSGAASRALRALREATGENFRNDPDAWRAWWKEAKSTFDFDARAEARQQDRDRRAERDKRREERESGGDGGDRRRRKKKGEDEGASGDD